MLLVRGSLKLTRKRKMKTRILRCLTAKMAVGALLNRCLAERMCFGRQLLLEGPFGQRHIIGLVLLSVPRHRVISTIPQARLLWKRDWIRLAFIFWWAGKFWLHCCSKIPAVPAGGALFSLTSPACGPADSQALCPVVVRIGLPGLSLNNGGTNHHKSVENITTHIHGIFTYIYHNIHQFMIGKFISHVVSMSLPTRWSRLSRSSKTWTNGGPHLVGRKNP